MRWVQKLAERSMFPALLAGAAGLLVCVAGLLLAPKAVFGTWLVASLFWLGLSLGALSILMVHYLTGGRWGEALRPPLRAMAGLTPLGLLFLVPLLFGVPALFPWAGVSAAELPEVVRHKLVYLNEPFLIGRTIFYAVVWLILARMIRVWTAPAEAAPATERRSRRRAWSAGGLILHGLAITFFSVDWMMSLEPEFYSMVYGMLEAAAQVVGAFAVAILMLYATGELGGRPGGTEEVALTEDLANLLFGFVLVWAYLSYMQWLLIWSANLPHQIEWYIRRSQGGWEAMLWLLVALHFVLPFFGFLSRTVKRRPGALAAVVGGVLLGHLLDVVWRLQPALSDGKLALIGLGLAAFVATGGLWLAAFLWLAGSPREAEPGARERSHA